MRHACSTTHGARIVCAQGADKVKGSGPSVQPPPAVCTKSGMNLSIAGAALIVTDLMQKSNGNKCGQPALSDVCNGLVKMEGSGVFPAALELAVLYAWASTEDNGAVEPSLLGYTGNDIEARKGSGCSSNKRAKFLGVCSHVADALRSRCAWIVGIDRESGGLPAAGRNHGVPRHN